MSAVIDTGAFYAITVALDRGGNIEVRQSACAVAKGDRVTVTISHEAVRSY